MALRKWEYATVEFWCYGQKEPVPTPSAGTADDTEAANDEEAQEWFYYSDLYVRRPGEEREKLENWSSKDPEDVKHRLFDLINELGSEGWEMVGDTILRSGLNLVTPGWTNASEPLHWRLTFKRPSTSSRDD